MGVFLLDATVYHNKPTMTYIQNLLRRNTSDNSPSGIPHVKWKRQYHVFTLTPRKNMLLEFLFEHNNNIGNVVVGVDDIQLFPVISETTKVAQ